MPAATTPRKSGASVAMIACPSRSANARYRRRATSRFESSARALLPVLARLLAVHQHDGLLEHLRRARGVGEHVRLALLAHARDQDRLRLAVLLDALGAVADADPGLADAAERQLLRGVVDDAVVDAGAAGLDTRRQALALLDVLRPDARVQAVARVVRKADRLLLVMHLHDRQRRAERLLGHAEHRVVDVGEDRRLEEVALALAALAADPHGRALVDRVADVRIDDVDLRRGGHGTDLDRRGRARSALAQRARLLHYLAHELLVEGLLDVDPLDRLADLPGVRHAVVDGGVGSALDVGVAQDDHRVLAAELERYGRERPRRALHHLLAGLRRAGEHEVVDVIDQRRPCFAASGRDLEDPVGEPGSLRALGDQQRRERRHLAGLQHHGVAGHQRGDAVAEAVRQRVVPGRDDADQATGL